MVQDRGAKAKSRTKTAGEAHSLLKATQKGRAASQKEVAAAPGFREVRDSEEQSTFSLLPQWEASSNAGAIMDRGKNLPSGQPLATKWMPRRRYYRVVLQHFQYSRWCVTVLTVIIAIMANKSAQNRPPGDESVWLNLFQMASMLLVVLFALRSIWLLCPRISCEVSHGLVSRGPPESWPGAGALDPGGEERPERQVEGGATYKGQWRGNLRHGQGTLTKLDGQQYKGFFVESRAHGHGRFIAANGNSYEGQWQEDRAHGYGRYVHIDGSTYEGQWQQDRKTGKGIESWPDGARYEGDFLQGRKHGVGIYRSSSSSSVIYEGQFRCDSMDGEGKYKFSDGRVYSGQWVRGHMSGHGKMLWPNNSKYEGSYDKDMKNGKGIFTWPDGKKYRGQWRDGRQHGLGTLIFPNGEETTASWHDGEQIDASRTGTKI